MPAQSKWTTVPKPLRRCPAVLIAFLLAFLVGCTPPTAGDAARPREAGLSASPAPVQLSANQAPAPAVPVDTPSDTATRRGREVVVPGTGSFVAPEATLRPTGVRSSPSGEITFSFNGADVRDVAREILGEQLHLAYVVDPKVNAQITAQTSDKLPREAVLPTLESILSASGLAMVESDGVWHIMPMQDAARATLSAPLAGQPGYGIRVIPLNFVSASEIKSVLDPLMPQGSTLQTAGARNVLIVAAPTADLDGLADLVRRFDVDWLAGTSFALYPLHVAQAKDVAPELEAIFGDGASGPLAGLVRIVPVDRLNAILVIAGQRQYLSDARDWITRFDYGEDQTTPRMFEYRVQNSRAADVAAVLTKLLGSGSVSTVQPETAPGTNGIAIGATGQGQNGAGANGLGAPGTSGLGTGAPGTGLPGQAPGSYGQGATGMGGVSGLGTAAVNQPGAPGAAPNSGATSAAAQGQGAGQGGQQGSLSEALQGAFGNSNQAQGELPLPQARVVADEKNNAIVVYAKPRDYRMIEGVIRQLDVVPLQVMIEATIAEVTLNNTLQYGVQWFLSHASNKFELTAPPAGGGTATGIGTAADVLPSFPGFNYVLGGGQEKLVLSALSEVTHVDVVSAPHLVVLDHQTAYLQVGDEVPTVTASAISTITTNAPIVNSVQYIGTGVILQVTPRVNNSGLVSLDIDQSVSDVETTTSSTINSPTISQRRITTSVTVEDGETVALGGLILDNRTVDHNGIPILKDIPVVGSLFGQSSDTKARTELLVLLTPRILRNQHDATAATDELRERMRSVRPLELRAR
ncbi:MAG TPA: type II secretion system secretin GspD [Stellaceae bacterium]|nr:type II secretion system secretin GspD [Stellaceae bacterium]